MNFLTDSSIDLLLSKQKKFSEAVDNFLKFIKDKRLVIHNAEFDIAHLNNELQLFGKNKIQNEIVDTLTLARNKYPGSQVSLDALCKRFRIDNSRRIHHTALIDCDLLAKVYINIIDQKEPTLDLKQNLEIEENQSSKNEYYKKVILPSNEELKKHREYLKTNLKKNYFN